MNGDIGPHRRFDEVTMDLGQLKAVRRALGGSLNDVVLTVVTGAVRRFMRNRQVDPRRLTFRVLTPVSVRAKTEQGRLGNRVSGWLVELPLDEANPQRQLERIHATTSTLKESRGALGAELLLGAAEWTPTTLLSLAGRQASRHMPFNLVVTNVPGPQWPMYMFGVRMLECFPFVPLAECQGLGIALMSYDGKLCWGLNGDYDLMPDLVRFGGYLRESFEELRALTASKVAADPAS
jgi:WS/DGAT/MGAT family acyltransferase